MRWFSLGKFHNFYSEQVSVIKKSSGDLIVVDTIIQWEGRRLLNEENERATSNGRVISNGTEPMWKHFFVKLLISEWCHLLNGFIRYFARASLFELDRKLRLLSDDEKIAWMFDDHVILEIDLHKSLFLLNFHRESVPRGRLRKLASDLIDFFCLMGLFQTKGFFEIF